MSLVQDKAFRKHVETYAADNDAFFRDFSDVLVKLFELGVPFTSSEESSSALSERETTAAVLEDRIRIPALGHVEYTAHKRV